MSAPASRLLENTAITSPSFVPMAAPWQLTQFGCFISGLPSTIGML